MQDTYSLLRAQVDELTQSIIHKVRSGDVNRLKEAVAELESFSEALPFSIFQGEVMSTASLNRLISDNRKGLLERSVYERELNKITHTLLSKVGDLPTELDELIAQSETTRKVNLVVPTDAQGNPDPVAEEKIIGVDRKVKISFLQQALESSKSICRVVLADGGMGTGFLIEGKYLLTNHHVLPSSNSANNAQIEFNYEEDGMGNVKQIQTYSLDASDFITDAGLDFSQVKVKDPDNNLEKWGALTINPDYVPEIGEPVNIIQHPKGGFKQISLTANEIISNDWKQYLFYKADTEQGSSGSPVFNKNWEVIAIHHAGLLKKEGGKGGMQINAQGDRASANRGIYFKYILPKITELMAKRPPSGSTLDPSEQASPPKPGQGAKKFFLLYAEEDRDQVATLQKHMFLLEKQGRVNLFDMHAFSVGNTAEDMDKELREADFILALVTYNFIFSMDAWIEKAEALGKNNVIPVLLNEYDLTGSFLADRKALPSNNTPVELWDNTDRAYVDIVQNIRKILT